VDQRALGELAERAAGICETGGPAAAAAMSRLVGDAAQAHGYAKWAMASMIAAEWDRLGIRRVPRGTLLEARV